MVVYALSGGAYLAFVVYGYRAATDRFLIIGWTFIAALSAALLVGWITLVNLLYLLLQIAMAVDGGGLGAMRCVAVAAVHSRRVPRAGRRLRRRPGRSWSSPTLASALAWSGVGLIAFVPLVGLAVFPLQLAALLVARPGVRVPRADRARRLRRALCRVTEGHRNRAAARTSRDPSRRSRLPD